MQNEEGIKSSIGFRYYLPTGCIASVIRSGANPSCSRWGELKKRQFMHVSVLGDCAESTRKILNSK